MRFRKLCDCYLKLTQSNYIAGVPCSDLVGHQRRSGHQDGRRSLRGAGATRLLLGQLRPAAAPKPEGFPPRTTRGASFELAQTQERGRAPLSHLVAVGSCRLHRGGVSRQLCRDAASRQSRSASTSDRNRLRKMSAMLNMVLIAVCLFFSLKTSEATEMHPERTFITDNTIS